MKTYATVEISIAENGYILRKSGGWTISETLVFRNLNEVIDWLKNHFAEV